MRFIPSAWCDESAVALHGLIAPQMFPLFLQWIKDGVAMLWKVEGEGDEKFTTWLITRIEQFPNGELELVLDVIAGEKCREIVDILIRRSRGLGFSSVRFETHHSEKLAKKFIGGLGFERVATVFKVQL